MKRVLMCSAAALMIASGAWGQEETVGNELPECSVEAEDECIIYANWVRLPRVEVAGLRPTYVDDITSSVAVIDEADLRIRNTPNVVEQLRAVPGVGVSRSGGPGALTQVRVRGAEANHTLVLIDGFEVSDPANGETDFGLLTGLPVSRVEVLRGEQSAIHGSDAIGGVVGLRTSYDARVNGLVEVGSRSTFRGEASAVFDHGSGTVGGAVSGFATSGVDTAGLGGEKDGASSYGAALFGNSELGSAWNLSGLAIYRANDVERDPDLDFDGRLDNADRETDSEQYIIGAALSGETGPVDHIIRASYNSVTRENSADGAFTDETTGERFKVSWSPSVELADIHQISGLIDYEAEDYERVSTDTAFGDPNQTASFDTLGFAGEYRLRLDGGLNFNASVRHDLNDDRFDDATTWRVGAAYNFFDFGGRLRASVGTGVKNPTFTELFGFFPAQFVGNPDLNPEESLGWEIGWDQTIGDLALSATYFQAELDDEIFTVFNFDPDTFVSTSTPANRDSSSERSGFELAGTWSPVDQLNINGFVSFIDSETDSGVDEVRVPETTASLGFDWQFESVKDMRIGVAFDYVGEQTDFNFGSFPAQTVELDDYTLVSATAELPVTDRLSLTFRGENLFDEDAVDVFGFNTPGTGVFIGLKLR